MMKKAIKTALREVYWAHQGKGLKNPILFISPKSILYVCKGNICRSPFAERLTIRKIEKSINVSLTIRSAGIDAAVTNPPPKEAIDSAKIFGISMDDHRSQPLTQELINGSDMIVVMEVMHLKQLEEEYLGSKGKCFLLSMFSNDKRRLGSYYHQYNIADPYGKNKDVFILCYEKIELCINRLLFDIGINV